MREVTDDRTCNPQRTLDPNKTATPRTDSRDGSSTPTRTGSCCSLRALVAHRSAVLVVDWLGGLVSFVVRIACIEVSGLEAFLSILVCSGA